MKRCKACLSDLPLTEFYKQGGASAGYRGTCKTCYRSKSNAFGRSKRGREIKKKYKSSDKGAVTEKRYKDSEKGRAANFRKVRKWEAGNKQKRAAHEKIYYAVRTGKIKRQSCQICRNERSQAHHDDYSKPLDVIWLCAQHHKDRHRWLTQQDYMI